MGVYASRKFGISFREETRSRKARNIGWQQHAGWTNIDRDECTSVCQPIVSVLKVRILILPVSEQPRSKIWTWTPLREAFMKTILVFANLLLLAATVNADTLVLRDGRRIEGRLISFQNGIVEFQQAGFGGQVGRISRDDIIGIEFGRVTQDRDEPRQGVQESRPRGLREKQVMVVANVAWSDTGIDVQSGQTIYLEAMGNIVWGPSRHAGPNGESNSPYNAARPIPNRPGGSLIGRVGSSSDAFFVGDDRGAIRVRGSGRLFLGINDDYLQDNSGYFRVIVYY
jgi:hypothetical protein